jgi:hypothetical protein
MYSMHYCTADVEADVCCRDAAGRPSREFATSPPCLRTAVLQALQTHCQTFELLAFKLFPTSQWRYDVLNVCSLVVSRGIAEAHHQTSVATRRMLRNRLNHNRSATDDHDRITATIDTEATVPADSAQWIEGQQT